MLGLTSRQKLEQAMNRRRNSQKCVLPVLLDVSRQAPSPSKDYVHLKVDTQWVTFTRVPITPMNLKFTIYPKVYKVNFEGYRTNTDDIQQKIEHFFPNCLDQVERITKGLYDPLTFLPEDILLNVTNFLNLEDIHALSHVSKELSSFCESDVLWEQLYYKTFCAKTGVVSEEMRQLADDIGWKKFYFSRVINTRRSTKKLQTPQAISN